jgi:hypothetical protein
VTSHGGEQERWGALRSREKKMGRRGGGDGGLLIAMGVGVGIEGAPYSTAAWRRDAPAVLDRGTGG